MRNVNAISVSTALALVLSGCANYQSQQEQTGMVIGGVLGGALGSQIGAGHGRTAAIILGSLAGAAVGGAIGQSMSESDKRNTAQSLESVRTGVPTSWRNPDTGNRYVVVPTRTYEAAGAPCRDYTVDAVIAGRQERVFGKACRQPDGSWQAVN